MDESVRPGQDAHMLRDGARGHAEQDQRAGTGRRWFHFDHHAARAVRQHLARAGLASIAAIGRDRERLGSHHVAPDPTC